MVGGVTMGAAVRMAAVVIMGEVRGTEGEDTMEAADGMEAVAIMGDRIAGTAITEGDIVTGAVVAAIVGGAGHHSAWESVSTEVTRPITVMEPIRTRFTRTHTLPLLTFNPRMRTAWCSPINRQSRFPWQRLQLPSPPRSLRITSIQSTEQLRSQSRPIRRLPALHLQPPPPEALRPGPGYWIRHHTATSQPPRAFPVRVTL